MRWTQDVRSYPPPGIDVSKPSVARVYDAILGGKDNFAADRAVAAEAHAAFPDGGKAAHVNRALLGRAVRYMAAQGVTQFIDLGSGLPTARNTHEIAQAVSPSARVAYVDNDPVVLAHGRALLADNDSTVVVSADLTDPAAVTAAPGIAGFLDLSRPTGLILNAVLHHVPDAQQPHNAVARYKELLAPGSYLLITHFANASEHARRLEEVLLRMLGSGQLRSREEITSFFDGFDLVQPGIVHLPDWRPDQPVTSPLDIGELLYLGGLARKP
jgi:SAM-dependent methyltransferase